MERRLEELIENRKEFVKTLKGNNFKDGFTAYLTNIYSDNIHFIYELLQNAEDMLAEKVRIEIFPSGIWFKHNGRKRPFIFEDIEALTSVNDNKLKKNDKKAIGKFGIGFKAIYSYTMTPAIYSSGYSFKVHDMFVPEILDTSSRDLIGDSENDWTLFYLPFDRPDKDKTKSYQEILQGLSKLNHEDIVFLDNIKTVDLFVGDMWLRTISMNNIDEYVQEFISESEYKTEREYNIVLKKKIKFNNDENYVKEMPIGISIPVVRNNLENSKKKYMLNRSVSLGNVYIFFKTKNDKTGLKFNINAPFESSVTRENVKENELNKMMLIELANLLAINLPNLINLGYFGFDILEIIPCSGDKIQKQFSIIRKEILKHYANEALIKVDEGIYKPGNMIVFGPSYLSKLHSKKMINKLYGSNFSWLSLDNSSKRLHLILKDMNAREFEKFEFFKKLMYCVECEKRNSQEGVNFDCLESLIQADGGSVLDSLLTLYKEVDDDYGFGSSKNIMELLPVKEEVKEFLLNERIIPAESNRFISPKKAYFPSKKKNLRDLSEFEDVGVVNNDFLNRGTKSDRSNRIEILKYCFEIKKLDTKEYITLLAKRIAKGGVTSYFILPGSGGKNHFPIPDFQMIRKNNLENFLKL